MTIVFLMMGLEEQALYFASSLEFITLGLFIRHKLFMAVVMVSLFFTILITKSDFFPFLRLVFEFMIFISAMLHVYINIYIFAAIWRKLGTYHFQKNNKVLVHIKDHVSNASHLECRYAVLPNQELNKRYAQYFQYHRISNCFLGNLVLKQFLLSNLPLVARDCTLCFAPTIDCKDRWSYLYI